MDASIIHYNQTMNTEKNIAIIGGGPAGLMAAERLARPGARVHLYDAMPTLGRKFLRAGVGGLNITHSEPLDAFIARYSQPKRLGPLLREFGPTQVVDWLKHLGFETFTGTSGRVFPVGMKSSPILRAWLKRLDEAGVTIHPNHRWTGIHSDERKVYRAPLTLAFETPTGTTTILADAVLLALGGGSWPKLGSTGGWVSILEAHGVLIAPLRPANCGFDVDWSDHFKAKFNGAPLKAITITFKEIRKQGEFIVTDEGIEGSLIYALSARLRDEIEANGQAIFHLDLAPDWPIEKLISRLSQSRGSRSISSHLQKTVGISGVKTGLLWEFLAREDFQTPEKLAAAIKSLPIPLLRPRPLAEAISSAGGVRFEALEETLMLRTMPGVFCAGEMLDWEAPTGGYLLTACFASGRAAGLGVWEWLQTREEPDGR